MANEKYNGWTNRETWLVNVHFDNSLSEMIEEDVKAGNIDLEELEDYAARGVIAERIERFIEDTFEEEIEGMSLFLRDFLDLGKIDYYELADGIYRELI